MDEPISRMFYFLTHQETKQAKGSVYSSVYRTEGKKASLVITFPCKNYSD